MNVESNPLETPSQARSPVAPAAEEVNEVKASACDEFYGRIQTDITDMLDFMRSEGKAIPEDLRAKVAELCQGKPVASNPSQSPDLSLSSTLGSSKSGKEEANAPAPSAPEPGARVGTAPPNLSLALEVHGQLSQMVAPANPRTIRASRLTGKYRFLADNISVKWLLACSIASLAIFLTLAAIQAADRSEAEMSKDKDAGSMSVTDPASQTATDKTDKPASKHAASSTKPISVMEIFMLLAAASLGSAFYGLYMAHKYIVNCTFDPKYHQVYLIRYVLGLTSGTILGFFGTDLKLGDSTKLSAAVLALVGGYAAEAVSQILQRFAETLVTVVRGNNDDVLQAKEGEMKAKAKQKEDQTKNDLAKRLSKAKDATIREHGAASPAVTEIQKTIDSLST